MADSSINTGHLRRRRDSRPVTIYKVPERLRRDKSDDYEPRIISFGPYHHGKQGLQAMEKYKWSFLELILSFSPGIPCERYVEAIKVEEAKIRTCYTDDFDIYSEEFVEMILIDACFLVGYLLQFYYGVSDKRDRELELDSIVCMHDLIKYDILLLENQLPFFILIKIFDLLEFTQSSPLSFLDLAINYLNWVAREEKVNFQPPEPVHHLFHLYHSHCINRRPPLEAVVPIFEEEPVSNFMEEHWEEKATLSGTELVSNFREEHRVESATIFGTKRVSNFREEHQPPSATVLYESGVKFEKKEVKGSSILDVEFKNGKIMIPPLVIDSFTKSRLRNLVAFEQFYPHLTKEFDEIFTFTAYVQFMDFMVNTTADVALLHKKGIIRHFLGSDKNAADFLNDLNQGVFVKPDHYLAPLYKSVYDYQKKHWPKWRAMLMHNYCNSPWAVFGLVAGGFLLVFTLLQTILSGYSAL